MACRHGPGQSVKVALAGPTAVFLPRVLGCIMPLFGDQRAFAVRTANTFWPPEVTNLVVALDLVQSILKVDHRQGNRQ
jgi:hypothetical protein